MVCGLERRGTGGSVCTLPCRCRRLELLRSDFLGARETPLSPPRWDLQGAPRALLPLLRRLQVSASMLCRMRPSKTARLTVARRDWW